MVIGRELFPGNQRGDRANRIRHYLYCCLLYTSAIDVVRKGEVKFVPERFDKIYYNWMENIRDWCISRQLWWGHRIPAWYCEDCGETIVAREEPHTCPKCGGNHLHQDEDTPVSYTHLIRGA